MQKLAFEGFFSRAANTGEETGASAIDWSTSCANSFPGSSTTRPLPFAPGNDRERVGEEPGNKVVL